MHLYPFCYKISSNYRNLQGKDFGKKFSEQAPTRSVSLMGQVIAGCYYAKSLHEVCKNPYFIFMKDYCCGNEKLKSSYE